MTREEAKNILDDYDVNFEGHTAEEIAEAFDMAFKALEQEPCNDAISIQSVLEMQVKYAEHMSATKFWQMRDEIKKLPPVNPQPKTGHWIPSHITESILDECSECGFSCGAFTFNYCPNCGARMESEVSE